jgi:hypothetical protein
LRNVLDKIAEKIKTRNLCSVTFFRKSWRLSDNFEKFARSREAADDSMAARCMLDN